MRWNLRENKYKQKRVEWKDGFKETWMNFSDSLDQQIKAREAVAI